MLKTKIVGRFIVWLILAVCFVGLPAMLIYTAIDRYFLIKETDRQGELKIKVQQAVDKASSGIDQEHFWCQKLSESFIDFEKKKTCRAELVKWLESERISCSQIFDFIVWNSDGEMVANSTRQEHAPAEWFELYKEFSHGKSDLNVVWAIVGPQYTRRSMEDNSNLNNYRFGWPDSTMQKPLLWARSTHGGVYLLLFKPACITADTGITVRMNEFSKGLSQQFGIYRHGNGNQVIWPDRRFAHYVALAEHLAVCEKSMQNFSVANDYYLSVGFLTPQLRVFGCIKKEWDSARRMRWAISGAAFVLLVLSPFLLYTWQIILYKAPGKLSIRRRIVFVFFFATALPFLAMMIFAHEHYAQKRSFNLKDAHQRSVALMYRFDEGVQSSFSRLEYDMKTYFNTWARQMHNQVLSISNNAMLSNRCRKNLVESFFIVASETQLTGSFNGVECLSETFEEQQGSQTKRRGVQSKMANIIGKKIMRDLNGQSPKNGDTDRFELLFESAMQKTFAEITHDFIRAMGRLSPWGFGKTLNLALLNFMSAGDSEKIDYMGLAIWNPLPVQRRYVERSIDAVNRNPIGLRIVVKDNVLDKYYPENYCPTVEVKEFFMRLNAKPAEEIEVIQSEGAEYMAVGFNGKRLQHFQILGLFPLEKIDRLIARQRHDLLIFAAFCLLLAAWLAQLLAKSFLLPLADLGVAALAIENRDFSYRIGSLPSDELGRVGTVLNRVMADFAELEVARVVQESLFPQQSLKAGGFKVYGKSLAMHELGGDYFDYFTIDQQSFAALMGDVAGHGVGAALIMAMAKAGIISSWEQLKTPTGLLERMHELVYSSKTRKQKKIMTFQYIYIDVTDCKAIYANAGGCSPLYYSRKSGVASEISLPGGALGAFKKAKFNQVEIAFEPGDMMVFYTDGIIEARNQNGDEIGYDSFARLIEASWHKDPEIVYDSICSAYYRHISGCEAQDDLTLMIISFGNPT